MSRYAGWHDEAAVQRLRGQQGPQVSPSVKRRPQPIFGAHRPAFSRVEPTKTGYIFTWVGWLPRISGHQLNRYARSRLCRLVRREFGELPPSLHAQRRAKVEVIRVLGPYQKPMDRDSLAQLAAGAIDGLKRCGFLKDDNERWSHITYQNVGSRRDEGPYIEIILTYEGNQP